MVEKAKDGTLKPVAEDTVTIGKKRGRWDKTADGVAAVPAKKKVIAVESSWEKDEVSHFYRQILFQKFFHTVFFELRYTVS